MKKVITLVLALAMVFAIAGSASALVADNALTTTNYSDRYALSIELAGGPVNAGATLTIPSVIENKAYVKNEILYYAITLVAKAAYKPETQKEDAKMVITGNGVNIASYPDVKGYFYDASDAKGAKWVPTGAAATVFEASPIYNTLTMSAANLKQFKAATGANGLPYDTNIVFSGMGLVTGTVAAPSVTVKIAMTSMTTNTNYIGLGNPLMQITKIAANKWQVVNTKVWAGVVFETNPSTNKCIKISYKDNTANPAYEVTKGNYYNAATGSWTYGWIKPNDVALPAADAALIDAIFTFMGFDYELRDTNALFEKDFIAKTTETNLVAVANTNAYMDPVTTSTVTIVPEDIVVPKTGSAASFAGIALIVLAVAAAFVAKKVRA